MIKEIEAYNVGGLPVSEFYRAISPSANENYQLGQFMVTFGSIFAIVGFILCIAGIVVPGKKPLIASSEFHREPNIIHQEIKHIYPNHIEPQKTYVGVNETRPKNNIKSHSPNYCSDCGVQLEKEINFCTNCGNKLND
jgi:hypothetical protein